ncbi:MAG: hypothetical protein MUE54_15535 [Anaerolineae bacterium]|nr:hypothetical protein [Anaerolineae bacterium]
MSLVLRNEELVALVTAEALAQHTDPEEWITRLILTPAYKPTPQDPDVRDIYLKAYAKARAYWQSVGDIRANLTDDELDMLFGAFDENGIPRLKDELPEEPPVGSLAYAGEMAKKANIRTHAPFDSSQTDEVLNEEMADDILKKMKDLIHG